MHPDAPQISRQPGKCKTLKFLYHHINKEKPQISPANNKVKGPQILTSLDFIFPFEMEAKLYAIACESYHSRLAACRVPPSLAFCCHLKRGRNHKCTEPELQSTLQSLVISSKRPGSPWKAGPPPTPFATAANTLAIVSYGRVGPVYRRCMFYGCRNGTHPVI